MPEKKSKCKANVFFVITTESEKIIVTTQFYRSQGRFFSTRRINKNNLFIITNTLGPLFILMPVFSLQVVVFQCDYDGSTKNYMKIL